MAVKKEAVGMGILVIGGLALWALSKAKPALAVTTTSSRIAVILAEIEKLAGEALQAKTVAEYEAIVREQAKLAAEYSELVTAQYKAKLEATETEAEKQARLITTAVLETQLVEAQNVLEAIKAGVEVKSVAQLQIEMKAAEEKARVLAQTDDLEGAVLAAQTAAALSSAILETQWQQPIGGEITIGTSVYENTAEGWQLTTGTYVTAAGEIAAVIESKPATIEESAEQARIEAGATSVTIEYYPGGVAYHYTY